MATYYVSPTGSDAVSCAQAQSIATPKKTISNAMGCLSVGDTLLVRGGNYNERIRNTTVASGTSWTNKVRIAAYPGEKPWLNPTLDPSNNDHWVVHFGEGIPVSYIEFDGINIDYSSAVSPAPIGISFFASGGCHHMRYQNAEIIMSRFTGNLASAGVAVNTDVDFTNTYPNGYNEFLNLTIHGSGGSNANYAYYIRNDYNLIQGNHIYDVGFQGVQIYDGDRPPTGNRVISNRIHDITQGMDGRRSGIIAWGASSFVANNVIYALNSPSNEATGISVQGPNNEVYHNTVVNNVGGTNIATNVSSSSIFRNNIGYGNSISDSIVNYGSAPTADHNLFGTNPVFVNAAGGDFHLQASSPAINTGIAIASVSTDFDGKIRPQGGGTDMGAFEFGGTVSSPPSAPTGLRIVP